VAPLWLQNVSMLLVLVLCLWSLFWISKDARRRGKSSVGAVFFALFAAYPVSLLWWLWLRPPAYFIRLGFGAVGFPAIDL